jgi:hypothetical protein
VSRNGVALMHDPQDDYEDIAFFAGDEEAREEALLWGRAVLYQIFGPVEGETIFSGLPELAVIWIYANLLLRAPEA